MHHRKYIIASGWWCDGEEHEGCLANDSSTETRSPLFAMNWSNCIRRNLNPEKVLIVDSASPLKPLLSLPKSLVEFVSLVRNFEHVHRSDTKYCGWTRAFLTGAFYALMNDADYVFLEQDVLFRGDIVSEAYRKIEETGADYTHGLWPEHGCRVEQSFVLVKRHAVMSIINAYMSISSFDSQMIPEHKFNNLLNNMNFTELPFGYGRRRPINFRDKFFYAQQLSDKELREMKVFL